MNPIKWLMRIGSVLNINSVKMVNTVKEIASWMTLSCQRSKGPPLLTKPIRLAGIMKLYSMPANNQLNRMINGSDNLENQGYCCNLRFPYQATVMNTFEHNNNRMQFNPLMMQ